MNDEGSAEVQARLLRLRVSFRVISRWRAKEFSDTDTSRCRSIGSIFSSIRRLCQAKQSERTEANCQVSLVSTPFFFLFFSFFSFVAGSVAPVGTYQAIHGQQICFRGVQDQLPICKDSSRGTGLVLRIELNRWRECSQTLISDMGHNGYKGCHPLEGRVLKGQTNRHRYQYQYQDVAESLRCYFCDHCPLLWTRFVSESIGTANRWSWLWAPSSFDFQCPTLSLLVPWALANVYSLLGAFITSPTLGMLSLP